MKRFIEQFENKHDVNLVSKNDSLFMKIVAFLIKPFCPHFMIIFFTTIRMPFQRPTIYYPGTADLKIYKNVLEHELMHAEQQRTTWGLIRSALLYLFFPLPFFFSGRWFIEREPYLNDINKKLITIDDAVNLLWGYYGWPWPKFLMKQWFNKKLGELKDGSKQS